jgi:hypothetical protein
MGNTRQGDHHPVGVIKDRVAHPAFLDFFGWYCSFSLDVSNRDSIIEAKKLIEEKEGKLHILVNKYVFIGQSSLAWPFHPQS